LGIPFGPAGIAAGAAGGGILGTAEGFMEGYSKARGEKQDKKTTDEFMKELRRQGETGVVPEPPKVMLSPKIDVSLNIDGQTLARVLQNNSDNSFSNQAPAFDGMGSFIGGDHQHSDK
jgi:hypothetical protein